MKLLFVADGRSPIALNWIRYFGERGHEVHLISTFPANPAVPLDSYAEVAVAFSGIKPAHPPDHARARKKGLLWGGGAVGVRTAFRHWLGPLTIPTAGRQLWAKIRQIRPDIVHAMRIPYEGMAAGQARRYALQHGESFPALAVSIWGNDFTLHARRTPLMRAYTSLALQQASALHADCQRDLRIARGWGFPADKPTVVLPGAGGVQLTVFYPPDAPVTQPVVINPRGMRAYVRNDTFFRSIPFIVDQVPGVHFVCPTMAGDSLAERLIQETGVRDVVELLPAQSRQEMAELFRRAQITVSPSTHDGTPNTLLEAMACGCFPVAGDLESIREWITPDENGLLIDPADPADLAQAVVRALQDENLRARAQAINRRLIAERADYERVMAAAESFYLQVAG